MALIERTKRAKDSKSGTGNNKPVYAPSQTKIILLPYQQAAGWPELNQRFPQAPGISMILTPTASADQFIQAVGRGSRRNSQGLTDVHLVANGSYADRHRLSQLLKGLQFIAATGSPAVAPFLKLTAECLDIAFAQRAASGPAPDSTPERSANQERKKIRCQPMPNTNISFRRSPVKGRKRSVSLCTSSKPVQTETVRLHLDAAQPVTET